jgi:hypothetical protein
MLVRVAQEVEPDRRHRARDGHPLGLDQLGQRLGLQEAPRHDEVGPDQGARIGQAPRVDVEHRHDREHAVGVAQPQGIGPEQHERVDHLRLVGVEDPLGVPGGPARVGEPGGRTVLELGVLVAASRALQELLVADRVGQRSGAPRPDDHEALDGLELGSDLLERGDEGVVDEHDLVLGVVGDVGDLLGEEPDVDRVEHGPHARHRHVELQVLLAVPAEGRDPVARSDPETLERLRQAVDALPHLAVARPALAVVGEGDDLGVAEHPPHALERVQQGERAVVLDQSFEHGVELLLGGSAAAGPLPPGALPRRAHLTLAP